MVEYRRRGPDSSHQRPRRRRAARGRADRRARATGCRWSIRSSIRTQRDRSLGTFMILDHIARARAWACPTSISATGSQGSRKMDYKGRFLPQERLPPTAGRASEAS